MFNSNVLDVAMGLIFVYLILGLMCTTVNEWIAQCFKLRSRILKTGIQALLNNAPASVTSAGRDLAGEFYSHSLVRSLSKGGNDPSYISAKMFSTALIDILGGSQPAAEGSRNLPAKSLEDIQAAIEALPESDVRRSLLLLLHRADNQVAAFQREVENWFEDAMDRVSGWYKKKTQIMTVVVAALITIFANADSVGIARKLFVNPTLRAKIVQQASARGSQPSNAAQDSIAEPHQSVLTPLEKAEVGELTGWSSEFQTFHWMTARHDSTKTPKEIEDARTDDTFPGLNLLSAQFLPWVWAIVPVHLFGWLLTTIAASLGAPFWFDTLNRFMNIRAAGTAPNEKGQDRSKV